MYTWICKFNQTNITTNKCPSPATAKSVLHAGPVQNWDFFKIRFVNGAFPDKNHQGENSCKLLRYSCGAMSATDNPSLQKHIDRRNVKTRFLSAKAVASLFIVWLGILLPESYKSKMLFNRVAVSKGE